MAPARWPRTSDGCCDKTEEYQETLIDLLTAVQIRAQQAIHALDGAAGARSLGQDGREQVLQGRQVGTQVRTGPGEAGGDSLFQLAALRGQPGEAGVSSQ